jgi:uncharacterized protein (TIGR00661 family)
MRVMFIVNGLGLGNSTRCHAIIQRLVDKGVDVHVATSGNGLWYFADKTEVASVFELQSLKYGAKEGQISILKTLLAVPAMFAILRRNIERLSSALDEIKPDLVISDSDYSFWPIKRRGIPFAALNNADVVFYSIRRFKDWPFEVIPQFIGVELLDFLFHRFVPDRVFSPTLDPRVLQPGNNVTRVGPIVRRGCGAVDRKEAPNSIVIMLSGSVFGSPVRLSRDDYPFRIDIIGRSVPDGVTNTESVVYHGRVKDSARFLNDADLVVINGGFSAVSEAFCMRKPMVVIPVPRHAEQWINGRTIEHLGVGTMAREEALESAMLEAFDKIQSFREAYEAIETIPDGAEEVAECILEQASR